MTSARAIAWLRYLWRSVRAVLARLAWPELATLSLLLFAGGIVACVNGPLRSQASALRAEVMRREVALQAARATGAQTGTPDPVSAFVAFLPGLEERDRQLSGLHTLAGATGVEFSRVAYAHSRLAQLPVRKTSVRLVFIATVPVCLGLVHELLRGMRNLSVDRVEFDGLATSEQAAARFNVRMEVSLFYRDEKGV